LFTLPASTISVGNTQAVDKFALLAQRLQHARQLHAAAVDHRHLIAVARQLRDSARAAFKQRWNLKPCSAEFNYVLHSRPSAATIIQDLPIPASPR
jgi:hypothetical protein